ncbi:MAG: amidohydrolase [Pseudomonadales bacterium]|jgi:predicted amidohydrolase YtcJ|nr:amidohydrolase [Pseudomonadales bacterium]
MARYHCPGARTLKRCLLPLYSLALLAPAEAATLLHNVDGWTATASAAQTHQAVTSARFDALLVGDDGRVLAAGATDDLRERAALLETDVVEIDGAGRFVMPGLIDAHGHFTSLGYDALRLNVTGLRSLAETVETIRAHASTGSGWITGGRWNQELWPEARFPTAADLDGVTDRPVWLRRVDGHAAWANRAALAAAGVTRDTPDPAGGQIIRDADGEPTGVMVDAAMRLVDAVVPAPDDATLRAAIDAAQEIMLSRGLVQVHDAGAGKREIETFQALAKDGALKVRLYVMLAGVSTLDAFDAPIDDPEDRVDVLALKLYSDGALGSRGAALFQDYSDDEGNRGLLFIEADALSAIVDRAATAGWQVGVHAIGTRANQIVLDAYEQVAEKYPDTRGRRHRVEHSQILVPADIERYARLGVVASMQPTHATSDMFMAEKRLGPERLGGAYAWQSLLASGAVLALGSDFPVEPPDPLYGIHAAVTRQNRDNEPMGGWRPEEHLTLEQALRGFTLDAAWAAHQEDVLGSLEPGKWADFVLLKQSPFRVPAEDLWKIEVAETWIAGERVYAAD